MSLSYFGLPPAVIRMKARRLEREERIEAKMKWDFIRQIFGSQEEAEEKLKSSPGWVHEIIGKQIQ